MTPNTDNNPDGFTQAVATALDRFLDPAWLGANSPLAAPYFLGHVLDRYELGETEQQRGDALQSALRRAATLLAAEQQELLRVAYFERNPNLSNVGIAMALELPERTFYRNKNQAIQDLGRSLGQTLLPPLRPETPADQAMIGRAHVFSACLDALRAGRSVYVAGAAGAGKTTLGSAIVKAWREKQLLQSAEANNTHSKTGLISFWFTVRPGLNDYLASFIFALGYFLRGHGAYHTWRQLVADRGKLRAEQMLGLIRFDLFALQETPVLLCIDEVDQLQPERTEHAQLLHLLEELRQNAPLLLLGQRVVLEAHEYHTLAGFGEAEVDELLAQQGIAALDVDVRRQLMERTRGNPALLSMVLSLHDMGADLAESLRSLEDAPSLEALFVRIWRRLDESERSLLMQLSVFRSPSPIDAWAAESTTLDLLNRRGLLQVDGYGGVSVPPHIRSLAQERTPAELRQILHLRAAELREARGETVAAMHHYVRAREPALAVWLWYANRTLEIERGRGPAALALLSEIASTDLAQETDRNILHVARGQLLSLAGRPEEADLELDVVAASHPGPFTAYARQLQGSALEMQGRADDALRQYRSALDALAGSQQQREVTLHVRSGFLHEFHFQNRAEAAKEALLARIKAEGFHGNVLEMSGNYTAARERYQAAFELATDLGDLASLSRAYSQLGVLTLKLGDHEAAIPLIEQAIDCDEQRGDLVSPLYDRLNLAYAHTLAGRHETAYEIAHAGLETAERLRHSYLIAGLAAGVGEACYGLNRAEDAKYYALKSLAQEEGYFRCSALTLLALVHGAEGDFIEAEKTLREAIASAQYAEDQLGEAHALNKLSDILDASGNLEAANEALEKALNLYQQLKMTTKIQELQTVLHFRTRQRR